MSRLADGIVSDLRDISLRSAPALLLVILGEFVLPSDQPVWSATLMRALGELGIEPVAARKAIQRTAERDTITPIKHGRRAQWVLSESGRRMLETGGQRVFNFTGQSHTWDGRWLVLVTTVPESRRQLRHHLRTRLTWCGLGSPTPGLWITPHHSRAGEVAQIIDDLGLSNLAFSYIGDFGPVGSEAQTVEQAWDLTDLRAHYNDFMERFRAARAESEASAFRNRVELAQAWRRFPYLDPALPARLTPGPWIGIEAAGLFHRKRSSWTAPSESYWAELSSEAAGC
jgi:phenylacetic acid degradation operon negative regulatory protein